MWIYKRDNLAIGWRRLWQWINKWHNWQAASWWEPITVDTTAIIDSAYSSDSLSIPLCWLLVNFLCGKKSRPTQVCRFRNVCFPSVLLRQMEKLRQNIIRRYKIFTLEQRHSCRLKGSPPIFDILFRIWMGANQLAARCHVLSVPQEAAASHCSRGSTTEVLCGGASSPIDCPGDILPSYCSGV